MHERHLVAVPIGFFWNGGDIWVKLEAKRMSLENMYTTSSSARALLNSRLFFSSAVSYLFLLLLLHKLVIIFQTHFLVWGWSNIAFKPVFWQTRKRLVQLRASPPRLLAVLSSRVEVAQIKINLQRILFYVGGFSRYLWPSANKKERNL